MEFLAQGYVLGEETRPTQNVARCVAQEPSWGEGETGRVIPLIRIAENAQFPRHNIRPARRINRLAAVKPEKNGKRPAAHRAGNARDRPTAGNRVQRPRPVCAKLRAPSERQLVSNVGGQRVRVIKRRYRTVVS